MEEKYSIYMRRERRKKNVYPRLCSIGEYSVRTEKKNTSAQKHIYHNHMTLQQGETYPALTSSHPVRCHLFRLPVADPLDQAWRNKAGGTWSGEGSNVCNRGGSKRSPTAALFPGLLSSMALAEAGWCGGARKDKIDLFCLWGEQLHTFTAILSVHSGL